MKLVIMLGGFILKILKLCNVVLSRVLVFFIYIYRYCVIGVILGIVVNLSLPVRIML